MTVQNESQSRSLDEPRLKVNRPLDLGNEEVDREEKEDDTSKEEGEMFIDDRENQTPAIESNVGMNESPNG